MNNTEKEQAKDRFLDVSRRFPSNLEKQGEALSHLTDKELQHIYELGEHEDALTEIAMKSNDAHLRAMGIKGRAKIGLVTNASAAVTIEDVVHEAREQQKNKVK